MSLFAAAIVLGVSVFAGLPHVILDVVKAGHGPTIGEFSLRTLDDREFSNSTVAQRPLVVFFGFTHCPNRCSTTLSELTMLLREMGEAGNELTPIFITVDPDRDDAETLRRYMAAFDPRIIPLRGDLLSTRNAAKAFAVDAMAIPPTADDGMDHNSGVQLVDANGILQGSLDMRDRRDALVSQLVALAHTAPTHVSEGEALSTTAVYPIGGPT